MEVLVKDQRDGPGLHLSGQDRLFAVAEDNEVRFDPNSEGMQGTTRGCNEAIKSGAFDEGADQADAASAMELESGDGSQDDAAKGQLASGRAEERGHRVVLGRAVMARPVVEGSSRDAELFGIVALGRVIGFAEVVQGSGDVRARPTERILAGLLSSGRLMVKHGSLSLRGLLAEPL